jgi:hypothetical protein
VALAGCYGSTEPATDIGPESATLNANGTANNGPATTHFEYWVTGSTNEPRWTEDRDWPAGASGAFTEKVAGLYAGRQYSFRMCGADGDGDPVCAQTRTFTTAPPVQDSVTGSWGPSPHTTGSVDARSGPSGENPEGRFSARQLFDTIFAAVTCLRVSGSRAVVGGVGRSTPDAPEPNSTFLAAFVDGGPSGMDGFAVRIRPGTTTPPDCASVTSFPEPTMQPARYGSDIVINDAP